MVVRPLIARWLVLAVLVVALCEASSTGAIMRIDELLSRFREQDFQRDIANVLLSDTRDINVLHSGNSRAGSGVDVYFQIREPSPEELSTATDDITRLSGDEKMLLLYQWWLTDSPRLDQVCVLFLPLPAQTLTAAPTPPAGLFDHRLSGVRPTKGQHNRGLCLCDQRLPVHRGRRR